MEGKESEQKELGNHLELAIKISRGIVKSRNSSSPGRHCHQTDLPFKKSVGFLPRVQLGQLWVLFKIYSCFLFYP